MATGPKWNAQRNAWYVQYWMDGKWYRVTVGKPPKKWKEGDKPPENPPPEAFAERTRLEGIERASRERTESGGVAPLRAKLEEHVARYVKESTRRSAEVSVGQFLAYCEEHGVRRFDQVDVAFCKGWIDRLAASQAINTVRRKRAQLAVAWSLLKAGGEIPDNPWDSVRPRGRETPKERGAWSPKQFEDMLEKAPEWLRDVLVLGVFTGVRIGALIRLEWRDWLRPETPGQRFGQIHVRKELDKAKKGYKVPVSRRLNDLLLRLSGSPDRDGVYMLSGRAGRPIYSRGITARAIEKACTDAGLPRPKSPNHHMRRTFGRWAHFGHLTGTPIPLFVVSRWLGHHSVKMTMEYLDIEEEDSTRFMVPDAD